MIRLPTLACHTREGGYLMRLTLRLLCIKQGTPACAGVTLRFLRSFPPLYVIPSLFLSHSREGGNPPELTVKYPALVYTRLGTSTCAGVADVMKTGGVTQKDKNKSSAQGKRIWEGLFQEKANCRPLMMDYRPN